VQAKIRQFHSLRALLQQAEGNCLLKGWDARYKSSLIYGQVAALFCNITAKFPREVQAWTEGNAVDLNCRVVEVEEEKEENGAEEVLVL
jgi:hypothetical protein